MAEIIFIVIEDTAFTLDSNGEYMGKMMIWGRLTEVFLEFEGEKEEVTDSVMEKINWLNTNREKVVDAFMAENDHYIEVVNEMIAQGDFDADQKINEDDFRKALFVHNVSFFLNGRNSEFFLDLDSDPDYLLGHLAAMEINSAYEVEFGGLNG